MDLFFWKIIFYFGNIFSE